MFSSRKLKCLGIAAGVLLARDLVHAEVVFTEREQSVAVKTTNAITSVKFEFVNAGAEPATVVDATSDCACLSLRVPKASVPPGAVGKIRVDIENSLSPATKVLPIHVTTLTGAKRQRVILLLRPQLVSPVVCSPAYVYWREQDPLDPVEVIVTIDPREQLRIVDVAVSDEAFSVVLSPRGQPGQHVLKVRPPAGRQKRSAEIRVLTENTESQQRYTHGLVARVL